MPGCTSSPFCSIHLTAESFLSATYPILRHHEMSANIIFAYPLERVGAASMLTERHVTLQSEVKLDESSHGGLVDSFWLTVWSINGEGVMELDIVLSCTRTSRDNLPIFLWTPHQQSLTTGQQLMPHITLLAEFLKSHVAPQRIFSVFGMTHLVKAFCKEWSTVTGFQIEPQPFYSACFTYCTPGSFIDSSVPMSSGDVIRRAIVTDLDCVTTLCKEFADDSIYFPLTIERARLEAQDLITKGQIWLYETNGEVSAICAATRNSPLISAITKVYTALQWRRRGFAEHLVRYVTRRLFECGKESVVLYVGHENNAQRVYDRVGFVGLCGKERPADVENALELGFANTNRGHW